MKIAVVYNRESQKVINLFGTANQEKYGLAAIHRIVESLKQGGHQVIALEGDKDLVDNLEEFMPRVLKGERPGMVFNLSYGIQGQARYTHVPSILEMIGIPYVGSGPLAHSLALDKVVSKVLFKQHNLPTPDFVVLNSIEESIGDLTFPLIVKPKNEALSLGLKVVHNHEELKQAVKFILETFQQGVLVERYIEGREINVGLLGNHPPQAFEPAEILFGNTGPKIFTQEDKQRKSGREIHAQCPADLPEALTQKAKEIAINAFNALGCNDCARVDMRLDKEGNFYLLEINSLPSLGEHGSYVAAAEAMGLDFTKLVNALVEVASARYFGTPTPPELMAHSNTPENALFAYLTEYRDSLETSVETWCSHNSRSEDAIGIQLISKQVDKTFKNIGLKPVKDLTDSPEVWTWETEARLENGILLIGHLDVPINTLYASEQFRRDPEFLHGEGIGSSRAPLAMLEHCLQGLQHIEKLKDIPLGVLYYTDEGRNCVDSSELIQQACKKAKQVLVLTSGNMGDHIIHQRRGQRRYQLIFEGESLKLGQEVDHPDLTHVLYDYLAQLSNLTNKKERIAVAAVDIKTENHPRKLPHRAKITLQVSFSTQEKADFLEKSIYNILENCGLRWHINLISERPPLLAKENNALWQEFSDIAQKWAIPLHQESSLLPSVAGLVPESTDVLCGIGPVAQELYTSQEVVSRISLVQRSLLLSQFLLTKVKS